MKAGKILNNESFYIGKEPILNGLFTGSKALRGILKDFMIPMK